MANSNTKVIIDIKDLSISFAGQKIIEAFSLQVAYGEKVTITGRSGAGKSTILRCLQGFMQPEAGSIHIAGKPLTPDTVWAMRASLAYVAQEPDLGTGGVREIIERPFNYRANHSLKANLSRLPEYFEIFNLPLDLLDKEIALLSGGEKQRVALICAILLDRHIFLLDEVASALDQTNYQAVAKYFFSRRDLTVLSVFHEPAKYDFSDRVVELPYYSRGG
ncbi:ATP-binding cassette domain-containing protein [bacterium]|nr:ATP-binding cassette domain-containing protein [bacterium]